MCHRRLHYMCSNHGNHSRLNSEHDWGGLYEHLMNTWVFNLVINIYIYIHTPKIMQFLLAIGMLKSPSCSFCIPIHVHTCISWLNPLEFCWDQTLENEVRILHGMEIDDTEWICISCVWTNFWMATQMSTTFCYFALQGNRHTVMATHFLRYNNLKLPHKKGTG